MSQQHDLGDGWTLWEPDDVAPEHYQLGRDGVSWPIHRKTLGRLLNAYTGSKDGAGAPSRWPMFYVTAAPPTMADIAVRQQMDEIMREREALAQLGATAYQIDNWADVQCAKCGARPYQTGLFDGVQVCLGCAVAERGGR